AAYGGDTPHLASALLNHTDPRVTEEHYNRASTVIAAAAYARIISGFRAGELLEPIRALPKLCTRKFESCHPEDAVSCEPVSAPNFLANREFNREFRRIRQAIQRCGVIITTPVLSGLHHRYARI